MPPIADEIFESNGARFRVILTSSVITKMLAHAAAANWSETGGVLAGVYSAGTRSAVVTHLAGPTPDSSSGPYWFRRGVRGLKDWLARLWANDVGFYIGEWHYHPRAAPDPSCVDRAQLGVIARSRRYHCPEPLLVIIGGDPTGDWRISVTVFTGVIGVHKLTRLKLCQ